MSYDTETIWRKDRDHFLHPWTHFDSFRADGSLVIAKASGASVFDSNGNRYLDGIGGLWCMSVGHGNEEIAEAVADQIKRLAYFSPFVDMTNPPAAELASKLVSLAPGDISRVFYTCSGSTANDTAVRLAHYYFARKGQPERRHIISRMNAYHGSTFLGASLSRKGPRAPEYQYLTDFIHHLSAPYPYRRPDGMSVDQFCDFLVEEMEQRILEIGPERVAAFFAEPIMGAGGVIVPPPGYHKRTYDLCRKYGILYVSDEVVTAFGRLGHWFASKDVFGIEPDMILCAKGMSSGYVPLAACLFSETIYSVIARPDPEAYFAHGYTYSGHPVSCVAGLKTIEIMEREDICGHVRKVGSYFEDRVRELADLPLVGDARGLRFMMCTEYVANKKTKELFSDELNIGKRIADACQARGLIIRPFGHENIMSPPLTMTTADVDQMVDTMRDAIGGLADSLIREGVKVA